MYTHAVNSVALNVHLFWCQDMVGKRCLGLCIPSYFMEYMCTMLGANSSSRFYFRVWTRLPPPHTHTKVTDVTDQPTHTSATADVARDP